MYELFTVTSRIQGIFLLLRSEIPSGMSAKLRTVAASNNRIHMPWSLLVRATYIYGVVLHAHPVRGESHNQRNTTGGVATLPCWAFITLQWFRLHLPISKFRSTTGKTRTVESARKAFYNRKSISCLIYNGTFPCFPCVALRQSQSNWGSFRQLKMFFFAKLGTCPTFCSVQMSGNSNVHCQFTETSLCATKH